MATAGDLNVALAEASEWVEQIPGVAAVCRGEDQGRGCIDVLVTEVTIPLRWVPKQLQGIPVRLVGSTPGIQVELSAQPPPS